MFAYLNGKPIAVPVHDPETESVDICSRCLRTLVVGKHHATVAACKESECPFMPQPGPQDSVGK